ncbi:GNAT family N-acetyltransferase [uncultured Roseobacter sp.]|uniref:GNAT family N-acetyltransferase n=1 Tax=uncultured Roseobacter sp. TaxID=114847 RepID=UPI0026209F98|nr:GNAT family N-acetyltransferase [uncultured Roseobacter sp.]
MTLIKTPTLETDRLILRGPKASDAEAFMAFYATERSQFTGGPMTPRQAWNFFGTEIGHWAIHGFGMFIVTRKGSDAPLGIVGHWYPWGWPEKEVGWVLFEAASEGQGIAFEAAKACVDHAWRVLKWPTIVSYIAHGNDASVALAKRLGALLDEEAVQPKPETPGYVYRHPRPEGLA